MGYLKIKNTQTGEERNVSQTAFDFIKKQKGPKGKPIWELVEGKEKAKTIPPAGAPEGDKTKKPAAGAKGDKKPDAPAADSKGKDTDKKNNAPAADSKEDGKEAGEQKNTTNTQTGEKPE